MVRTAIGLLSCIALSSVSGCDDNTAATPQAIFDGSIRQGDTANDCRDIGELFTVGDPGNPAATPPVASHAIKNGEAYGQGTLSVGCSVKSSGGNEFDVSGSLDLTGATGGFINIDGKFRTDGEQTNIHAKFASRRTSNQYEETDRQCTVRYTTQFQGVAAGRVWGSITCPRAQNAAAQTTCGLEAEFRFENCAQ